MSESAGEKTQAPTAKRKKEAADRGEILRSRDFSTAAVVLAGCIWLAMSGPSLLATLKLALAHGLEFGRADVDDFEPLKPILTIGEALLPHLAVLFALTTAAAIGAQAGLGSLRFNASLFAPKASRINPLSGLGRMFGPSGLIELGKSLLKVALLGAIGFWLLWSSRRDAMGLASGSIESSLAKVGSSFTTLLLVMGGGLVLIAGVDVPVQLARLLSKLRMTQQEVRDEHKETDGNPEVKGHLRQRQRELLKGGARKAVAEAHLVLTNPTHFAVALRYDRGKDRAPIVVAKGRGATALAIRELAGEMAKPVLEYPQLARAIYYTSSEGQQIRDDLYIAVATVLAFVFGVNSRAGGKPPSVLVPDEALFDENGQRTARG